MSQHQQKKPKQPLAHQITVLTIQMKNGAMINTFSVHSIKDITRILTTESINGFAIISTGDVSDADQNATMILPVDQINIFTVADVKQPSNIIKPASLM